MQVHLCICAFVYLCDRAFVHLCTCVLVFILAAVCLLTRRNIRLHLCIRVFVHLYICYIGGRLSPDKEEYRRSATGGPLATASVKQSSLKRELLTQIKNRYKKSKNSLPLMTTQPSHFFTNHKLMTISESPTHNFQFLIFE